MVSYKDTEKKMTTPKRTIKVDCVSIEDGVLCDEDGAIAERIADALPNGVEEFTLKITINLPEEGE